MSNCDTQINARRNADFRFTYGPNSRKYTFSGMAPRFSVRRGEVELLAVTNAATVNGSSFIVVGDDLVLTVTKEDLALLDSSSPDTQSENLFYDITLVDQTGFENWLLGNDFILLGINDETCCNCNGVAEVSIGGQCVIINIDGGNLGPASSVGLAELNQAVGEAREAAEDAEESAQLAASVGASSGAAAGAAAGSDAGAAAGTAAAELVTANKVDLNAGNIIDWDVFKKGARIVTPNILSLKNISAGSVQSIFVEGRLSNNDGYSGEFTWLSGDQSANVSNDVTSGVWVAPNGSDGSTGAWKRVYSGGVDIRWFGVDGTGENNDTPAIAAAMYVANGAKVDCLGVEKLGIGSTVFLDDGANLDGGNFKCTLVALSSFSGDMVKTRDWDTLYGNNDAFAPGVLEKVRLSGFIIDGQHQNANRSAYVRTSGHGVLIYARKPEWDLRVYNVPGKGFHSYCPGGNGPVPLLPGYARQLNGRLYVHQTKEEGFIWEGPPDVAVGPIFQSAAGSRIAADDMNGKVSSPTYGATNGGQTDGVIINSGGEFSLIHAWGNLAGCGLVRYGGRFNCGLMIVESNHFGGAKMYGGNGSIPSSSIHRNGGYMGDTTPDLLYAAPSAGNLGTDFGDLLIHQVSPPAGRAAHDRLVMTSDSRRLTANVRIIGGGNPGHGIVAEAGASNFKITGSVAQCSGLAPDATDSCAYVRNTTGYGVIELAVDGVDQVFRSGAAPTSEDVRINFNIATGKLPFSGTVRTNAGQRWDINGVVGTQWRGTKAQLAVTFSSMSTTEQAVSVAHNLIAAPSFGKISTALVDIGSPRIPLTSNPSHLVSNYDDTNITLQFKIDTATGSEATPRVWVTAEV